MSDRKKAARSSSQYAGSTTTSTNGAPKKPSRSFSLKSQKPPEEKLTARFNKALNYFRKASDDAKRLPAVAELRKVVEYAWNLPGTGPDIAYDLSDVLRREDVLDFVVIKLTVDSNRANKPLLRDIQNDCAGLLEQILTVDNRHYVARNYLDIITEFCKTRDDIEIVRTCTGILEAMFKDSESTCSRLIDLGALDAVLYACRYDDEWTARHCAGALANAALFGGASNHRKMVTKGAAEWLFPLAFRQDNFCQFYSSLAVTILASNPLVENAVVASGTLQLVEPFVKAHDPYEFAVSNGSLAQGKPAAYLQRLIPLLLADQPETQALGAFYFAMEASIKAKQQKTQVFSEICAIVPLKRVVATSRSTIARTLASRCMKIIGEDVPKKLSPQVHLWDVEDVQSWLTIAGFRAFQPAFRESAVDGEMLLLITEKELTEDLNMTNTVHRKRFIRDLNRLRSGADYRSCDPSNLSDWLRRVDQQFAQYTLPLIRAGIDRNFLSMLTDEHLKLDCGIANGVHRTRILNAVKKIGSDDQFSIMEDGSHANCDVYIGYRKKNGAHLASLIKIHLQLRGYKVYCDTASVEEDDYSLRSVKNAKVGFVLVLTPGSLDKCAIDTDYTDWVHKEVVSALSSRKNIVPVTTEGFQWPMPDQLPADMKQICFFNGVKWVNDYQEGCVEKVDKLLKGTGKPVTRGQSMYGSRDILTHSQSMKLRNPQPTQVVRPSGSTDNLDSGERPRQRSSPPGQASHMPASGSPSSQSQSSPRQDVAGSAKDSTRRLDQADGASSNPHISGKVQYQPKPVTSASDQSKKRQAPQPSSRTTSTVSLASSRSVSSAKPLQTDIVKIGHVLHKDSDTEDSSSSSSSFAYESSSSDSEEEVHSAREERSGADGKSHPNEVKQSKPVDSTPPDSAISNASLEKIGAHRLPGMNESVVSSSTVSPLSSPEHKPRRPSMKKYHAPAPPSTDSMAESEEVTASPKIADEKALTEAQPAKKVARETDIDSTPDFPVVIETDIDESQSSDSSEESSSGEEEFHSTTRSLEDINMKTPVETIEESSEHDNQSSSSSSSEESGSESDQETVTAEKEPEEAKEEVKESDHHSETEVLDNDNTATLPHDNARSTSPENDNKLTESDFTNEDTGSSSSESENSEESETESESEDEKPRDKGDGSDEKDFKKYISSEGESEKARDYSSSSPSELDVEPMKVMSNAGNVPSANTNNSNNISPLSARKSSEDTDGSASRSPTRSTSGSNKLLARVDIAPTISDLQYSPRRSPQKSHPQQPVYRDYVPRSPQARAPPYAGPPRQYSHPNSQQGYPYHKPMTSASLNALYPPHPSSMQQPPVKRASSRGSLGSNSAQSRLMAHHPTQGFDTAV